MPTNKKLIQAVPTHIITGFLGVGKTSLILQLLKKKPAHERWAVLVNEFGEIGVDGSLLSGQYSQKQGVFISEVAGGCMCCAAGVPMQITLNQLLKQAKPDRLLIEPTGLGHPKEVLRTLSAEHYKKVLSIQKTLTLVDARKLTDTRYTSHEIFNQQIAIADIVIGHKEDLYQQGDKEKLASYIKKQGKSTAEIVFASQGKIDFSILNSKPLDNTNATTFSTAAKPINISKIKSTVISPEKSHINAITSAKAQKTDQKREQQTNSTFKSIGWQFPAEQCFSRTKLLTLFSNIKAERLKAVCITDQGLFGYNVTVDGVTETAIESCTESRIELILTELDKNTETLIRECLV